MYLQVFAVHFMGIWKAGRCEGPVRVSPSDGVLIQMVIGICESWIEIRVGPYSVHI